MEVHSLADDTKSILAVTQPDLTWSCDLFFVHIFRRCVM